MGQTASKAIRLRTTASCGPSHMTSETEPVTAMSTHDPDCNRLSGRAGSPGLVNAATRRIAAVPMPISVRTKRQGNFAGATSKRSGALAGDAAPVWP